MSKKTLSTFEREMQNEGFRQSFEEGYKEFVLLEKLTGFFSCRGVFL